MSPLTLLLLAAAAMDHVEAQRAAERIRQAQCCAAVERRAQYREIDPLPPVAEEGSKPNRGLSNQERAQLRQALERLARCSTSKLIYDQAAGFYAPELKVGCR